MGEKMQDQKSSQESKNDQGQDEVIKAIIIKEFCEKLGVEKKEKCVDFYVGSKKKERGQKRQK